MKRYGIISFTILILLFISLSASAAPIYGPDPVEDKPTLVIRKHISDHQILEGETITVNVNITNLSSQYAYNLTITEPKFNPSIIKTEGNYEIYKWVQLGKGAVITYSYNMTPVNKGQYTLEPTRIEYVNVNGTSYHASSTYIPFEVLEEQPPEATIALWNDILTMTMVLAAIPIVVYYSHQILSKR